MAMDGDLLGTEIKTAVEGVTGATLPAMSDAIWKAIANAIVLHITTNGIVTTPDTVNGTII